MIYFFCKEKRMIYEISASYKDETDKMEKIKCYVEVEDRCKFCNENGHNDWIFFKGVQTNFIDERKYQLVLGYLGKCGEDEILSFTVFHQHKPAYMKNFNAKDFFGIGAMEFNFSNVENLEKNVGGMWSYKYADILNENNFAQLDEIKPLELDRTEELKFTGKLALAYSMNKDLPKPLEERMTSFKEFKKFIKDSEKDCYEKQK